MKRVVVWAVLLLSALFLLTTGGTYPGIASVEAHIIGQVIAYVVLGGWCVVALFRPEWRPSTPLLLPIALATGAYLLSFVFSQRPRLSLEPTIAGVGWAVGYLFLSRLLAEPWFRTRVRAVLVVFTAMVAVGYIVQVMVEWVRWWNLIGFLAVPPLRPSFVGLWFGSPNLVATALLLTAPLTLVVLWELPRQRRATIVLAAATLAAIVLSGSRGGWLGVSLGAVAAVVLVIARHGLRKFVTDLRRFLRHRPLVVAPLAALALTGVALLPAVLRRFTVGGGDLRLDLWNSALHIFGEHPVLGAGPGTWVQLKLEATPPAVPNLVLPHAHNLYLQAAAEVGLVGLVALSLLCLATVRLLWRARQARTPGSTAATAVLVGLVAFGGQSLVDNLVNLPFVCLGLILPVAWVDAGTSAGDPREIETRRLAWLARIQTTGWLPVSGLVVLALVAPVLVRVDSAALAAVSGDNAALRGSWTDALSHYQAAQRADPDFVLYQLQTAAVLSRLGRLEEASEVLGRAVESDPLPLHFAGLAQLQTRLGDHERALAVASTAVARDSTDAVVALNAGYVAEVAGDEALAIDRYARAVALHPPLAGSAFWDDPVRSALRTDILTSAQGMASPLEAALVRAYGGDPDGARDDLRCLADSPTSQVYLAAVDALDGDTAGALSMLEARLEANPHDWLAAAWAARVAARAGASATAARFAAWAAYVQADSARNAVLERGEVRRWTDGVHDRPPPNYPWSVYLRPIPPAIFVAQLLMIGEQ